MEGTGHYYGLVPIAIYPALPYYELGVPWSFHPRVGQKGMHVG